MADDPSHPHLQPKCKGCGHDETTFANPPHILLGNTYPTCGDHLLVVESNNVLGTAPEGREAEDEALELAESLLRA